MTAQEHRVLSFVSACLGSGYAPTVGEVETWLASPHPRPATYSGSPWSGVATVLAAAIQIRGHLEQPAEPAVAHLVRIGWLAKDGERVSLSQLGQAMNAAAERSEVIVSEPTVVRLGNEDPLAYPTLFAELAKAGAGMLIDPYVRVDQLHLIVTQTRLARILIKKTRDADLSAIGVYLTASLPRNIEVRVTNDRAVHDRLIVRDDGLTVQVMGASINTVEKGTGTVIMELPGVAASAMRQEAEKWWAAARPIPQTADGPEPPDTDVALPK